HQSIDGWAELGTSVDDDKVANAVGNFGGPLTAKLVIAECGSLHPAETASRVPPYRYICAVAAGA
ncbi:MAG TPA: hypothetical protein VLF15_08760, partial [Pseudoxanthomonas sp.]|nr:hypothetical protein [Pseudoxanthomonas sp.]